MEILASASYKTEYARAKAINGVLIETPVRFWPTLFWLIQERTPQAVATPDTPLDPEDLEMHLREVLPQITAAYAQAHQTGDRAAVLLAEALNFMSNSRRVVALAVLLGEFRGDESRG